MDIHKPKAAHSLREFAVELFTIVLGIVIAICLEQFVESVHWHHEVAAGRQALKAEIGDISHFYAFRIAVAPCVDRQLDEIQGLINAANSATAPAKAIWNAPDALLSDSEWQSQRASQTLTHFPREELALMGRFYAQLADVKAWQMQEENAWAGFGVLRDPALSPADLAQLRTNLHQAQNLEILILINARRQLATGAQLGVTYDPVTKDRIERFCAARHSDSI